MSIFAKRLILSVRKGSITEVKAGRGDARESTISCWMTSLPRSHIHLVEQVSDRLHHGVWTVRVDCDVSGVFEHTMLTARNRFG